ncbi:PASTA domain-containing protein [Micromonospora phytophila]|uniref:PASTA domain-containing protein n=1 Tax=Micromonospora phytophila TaxID=709888 RepID=UPI00202DC157|nr:PASTA domain-containing protein [Micromonospora phytophila]MCM0678043.1 PASTA domain-containing protein [Micromonospora phytophila]
MSDDRQEPPTGGYDDQTRPLPPPAGSEPVDRTQRLPGPEDRTAGQPRTPDDATRPTPADRTAPMDRTTPLPPDRSGPPAWSGRAEVPPPRPADPREAGTEWYAEDPGGRRWWLPILWGVIVLLLLGLLGVGLWLALQSAHDAGTGPEPSPSPSRTSAAPTTAAPTSAAPTTSSPSAAPTTSAPARVPMPPVVNLPLETARAILDDVGLDHRVEYRESDRPPNTVVETEPDAGELVAEGEEVTLVVSRPEPSPTTGSPTPTVVATSVD